MNDNFPHETKLSLMRKQTTSNNMHYSNSVHQLQNTKYQCFRYEMHLEDGQYVIKMSQTNKGSCEGLWSVMEGDRTYTLKKGMNICK